MQTDKGWFSFNRMRENFQVKATTALEESRLEVISIEEQNWYELEANIKRCLHST
jgi:nicotinamide riboside kinase